jgi:two-component system chemotaxis response regulator CheY
MAERNYHDLEGDGMGRIMIVDDEVELLSMFKEMLELFGHDVVATEPNGLEAVRVYNELEEKPDLIILDHRMPVRNGLETAQEILSMNPDEKIIFISADQSVRKSAMDIGVLKFLEKPVSLQILKDTIQEVLKE